jgi:phage protein D
MLPDVSVYLNSSPLPLAAMSDLRSVTVQEDLHALSMFTLELHNWDTATLSVSWSDSRQFAVGGDVQIWLGYVGDLHQVMSAEITSLEPVFAVGQQPVLLVRGYDRRHRLARGSKSRTFLHMKDSAIATQIARDAGLRFEIDDSQAIQDYVIQSNQSDLEFLRRRASLIGYEIFVRDNILYFRSPKISEAPSDKLSLGEDITEFSPRLSTLDQPTGLNVRAWDVKKKKVVVATARPAPYTGGRRSGPDTARRAFGAAAVTLTGQPARNLAQASVIADGQFSRQELTFVEGDVIAFGRPQLRAGTVVEISGAGQRFSGRYYITSVTHTMTQEQGYQTSFTVQRNGA